MIAALKHSLNIKLLRNTTFKWYLNPDGQVNVLVQYWHCNDFLPGINFTIGQSYSTQNIWKTAEIYWKSTWKAWETNTHLQIWVADFCFSAQLQCAQFECYPVAIWKRNDYITIDKLSNLSVLWCDLSMSYYKTVAVNILDI